MKPLHQIVGSAAARLREWRRLARSRRELASFDEHQLRDLGIGRSQALIESGKSFLRR